MYHQAFFNHETHRALTLTITGPIDFSAIDPDIESFGLGEMKNTEVQTGSILVPIERYDELTKEILSLKSVINAIAKSPSEDATVARTGVRAST